MLIECKYLSNRQLQKQVTYYPEHFKDSGAEIRAHTEGRNYRPLSTFVLHTKGQINGVYKKGASECHIYGLIYKNLHAHAGVWGWKN